VKLLYVRYHISFLVESHVATVHGAYIWTFIGVDALMREEFVHALEHLHTFADWLTGFVSLRLEKV
jgi:hypothetical protein